MDIFDGLDKDCLLEHVAIQTAYDMLPLGIILFQKLGYTLDQNRKVQGTWGTAVFLNKINSITIQLTEPSQSTPSTPGNNHIAFMVHNPEKIAQVIKQWVNKKGLAASIEDVPGGKYFVHMPGIIVLPLEFIPNPRVCKSCFGEDSESCHTCKGHWYDTDE